MSETPKRLAKAIRMNLAVENLVSGERLQGKYPVQGVDRRTVQLVEIIPEGAVLDVPVDFCGQGEKLAMDIRTEGLTPEIHVQVRTHVKQKSFEKGNQSRDSVRLEFSEAATPGWKELRGIFSGRQADAMAAFLAFKGEES